MSSPTPPPNKGSNVVKLPPISVKSNERAQEGARPGRLIGIHSYLSHSNLVMNKDKGELSRDIEEEESKTAIQSLNVRITVIIDNQ